MNLHRKPKALVLLQVLAMLHALRKVCNHPACLDPEKYPQEPEFGELSEGLFGAWGLTGPGRTSILGCGYVRL